MLLWLRSRTWLRRQPDWVLDGVIAACAVALKFSLLASAPGDATFLASQAATAAAVLLSLSSGVPLMWRRRAAGPVLAVVGLSAVGLAALGVPTVGFGLVVAVYSVAAYAPRRESLASLAVFSVLVAVSLVLAHEVELAAVNALVFVSAWVLGDQQRTQRERTAALERRAQELERQRATRARLAAAEEREHIAGELHDQLAHSVAAMVTQAVAAERLITSDAGRATTALLEVERTGRQSLGDLRRLLGLLRDHGDLEALAPQPDLDDLPGLIGRFQDRGLPVRLILRGSGSPPADVGLSAYRIVQAALEGVLDHAGAVPTAVTLDIDGHGLTLEVVNETGPRPAAPPSGGRALAAMRERATLVGGTVAAGFDPDGRFAVRARLPGAEAVR